MFFHGISDVIRKFDFSPHSAEIPTLLPTIWNTLPTVSNTLPTVSNTFRTHFTLYGIQKSLGIILLS
jgi:hypothetical protein